MGNVRGYINDESLKAGLNFADDLSVEYLIGHKGCIQVLKDLGMNSIFTGITDMPYGNIVEDFSYYFKQSEQLPTFFYVNMLYNENSDVVLSRGIMAQLLPGASVSLIDDFREIISENQSIICSLHARKAEPGDKAEGRVKGSASGTLGGI
jgi:molecular chaperone Hsp33